VVEITHPLQHCVGQGHSQDSHSHPPYVLPTRKFALREEESTLLAEYSLAEVGSSHVDRRVAGHAHIQLGCRPVDANIVPPAEGESCCCWDSRILVDSLVR
jgi:hypothetical protein